MNTSRLARMMTCGVLSAFLGAVQAQPDPTVQDLISRGKAHVQLHLKEAYSANFSDVWPYRTAEGRRAVCGRVTSKAEDGPVRFAVSGSTVLMEGQDKFAELYAAWCHTPIADDGSVIHDASPQEKYSPDLELKGQRIGDPRSKLSAYGWTCSSGEGQEICYSDPGSLGGAPCKFLATTYRAGQLHHIAAFIEHRHFDQVKLAMIAKFGTPSVTVSEYQNAMGAKFTGATLEWPRHGGTVTLIERAADLTRSAVIVQSREHVEWVLRSRIQQGIQGAPDL